MRKKSHISLAKGIIHGLGLQDRMNHRFTFYLGSIWPDCIPSFLVKKHCIDETFDIFGRKMEKFIEKYKAKRDMGYLSSLRMGVITHYVADYFTYPHNSHYPGGFVKHCIYEEDLKHKMYSFIDEVRSKKSTDSVETMLDVQDILTYVREKHNRYMSKEGNVDFDCGYSFSACMKVVASLLEIVRLANEEVAVAY